MLLKRDPNPPTGASKAYRESQTRICKLEAPLFVGVGEGTDNLDFLADLSALKVIDPDEVTRAVPPEKRPVPRSDSLLLQRLKHDELPYAHCAWCPETPKTRSMLEEHYYTCTMLSCSHPAAHLRRFQTITGKELRLRQGNFGSYSTDRVALREGMKYDEAKDILGASCVVLEDKSKMWYVKMPQFIELGDTSLLSPQLKPLDERESDLNEYMDDPTDPVICVPEQDHDNYWSILRGTHESMFGGSGSTVNSGSCLLTQKDLLYGSRCINSCFLVHAK